MTVPGIVTKKELEIELAPLKGDFVTVEMDFYKSSHPTARDLLLVVEIADLSLTYDREVKLPLYARSRIPEVWIVDLENRCVRVFQEPAEKGFARTRTLAAPLPADALALARV